MEWTQENQIEANSQGWGLYLNCDKNELELQRFDEANVFPSDFDAFKFVQGNKGELCEKALTMFKQENPMLYLEYISGLTKVSQEV